MQSINPNINELHQAYCECSGIDLPLHPRDEKWWLIAISEGITPDQLKLVVKARIRGITTGDRKPASIYLRNLIGDEDVLAEFAMELAAIKASMRKKVYSPGKASVLESTGRPGEPEQPKVRHVSEVFVTMKNAAQ